MNEQYFHLRYYKIVRTIQVLEICKYIVFNNLEFFSGLILKERWKITLKIFLSTSIPSIIETQTILVYECRPAQYLTLQGVQHMILIKSDPVLYTKSLKN